MTGSGGLSWEAQEVLQKKAPLNEGCSLVELAARFHLPAVYAFRNFATSGGLISYGTNPLMMWREGASYVDRVLKGAKPADLPAQFPTKYELVINVKTAKTLGLTVPPLMLGRADDIIE